MSDSYRPRPDDHLVEPMFAGLGVEPETPVAPRRRRLIAMVLISIGLVGAVLWLWLR